MATLELLCTIEDITIAKFVTDKEPVKSENPDKTNLQTCLPQELLHLPIPILILDVSGSMGQLVGLALQYTQKALITLGYDEDTTMHIITFSSCSKAYVTTIRNMMHNGISSWGGTSFSEVPNDLLKILSTTKNNNNRSNSYNIICISDGEISDQEYSMKNIENLKHVMDNNNNYNVCSIRLFSSTYGTPDTRVLVGVSRLDNTGKNIVLQEIPYGLPVTNIIDIVKNNLTGTTKRITLQCTDSILMNEPWTVPSNTMNVNDGSFCFLRQGQDTIVTCDSVPVKIIDNTNKYNDNYQECLRILEPIFDKIDNTVKVLKITDTLATKSIIVSVKEFIKKLTTWENRMKERMFMDELDNDSNNNNIINIDQKNILFTLSGKRNFLKKQLAQNTRSIINALEELANDDNISKLNSNQKAEFLRSNITKTRKTTRLTKVAGVNSDYFDIDARVRIEVQNICKRLQELQDIDIDDVNTVYNASFFSQEHILDSLRQLPEILPMLSQLSASDIFKMINITGIGCTININEYPDPKMLNIVNIYPNCFVSMPDIILYHKASTSSNSNSNNNSKEPNYCDGIPVPGIPGATVNSVIPIFDDIRILKFMLENAPTILEVGSSINIRRLALDVPGTFYYNMCSGAYKLIQNISDNGPTELMIDTLGNIIKCLDIGRFIGYYKNICMSDTPLLQFNSFTGITNSLIPIIVTLLVGKTINNVNGNGKLSQLLRDIYNFDTYHKVSGFIKYINKQSSDNIQSVHQQPQVPIITETEAVTRMNIINEILDIQLDTIKTGFEPFTEDPEIPKYTFHLLQERVDELYKKYFSCVKNIKYLATLSLYLDATKNTIGNTNITTNTIKNELTKNLEIMETDQTITNIFQVTYSSYKTYAIHQLLIALMYDSQSQRLDIEGGKVLVPNFQLEEEGQTFFTEYGNKKFETRYQELLKKKYQKEKIEIATLLADNIIMASDKDQVLNLFKNGIIEKVRGQDITYSFANQYSEGIDYLTRNLLDEKVDIPIRSYKLRILILGADENMNRIWNGENINKSVPIKTLEPYFSADDWTQFLDSYNVYKTFHKYRSSNIPNRHGYSNNNPSFYGLGYDTLEEFIKNAPREVLLEYVSRNKKKINVGLA